MYDEFTLIGRLDKPEPFQEAEWHPEATAYLKEEQCPLTDMPFCGLIYVHSPRLKALMEQLGFAHAIQYLPIAVRRLRTGEFVAQYYVAHFLHRVICLDKKLSHELRIVLRLDAIKEERLFMIAESPSFVIVREDTKRAIQRARITGCKFVEAEVV